MSDDEKKSYVARKRLQQKACAGQPDAPHPLDQPLVPDQAQLERRRRERLETIRRCLWDIGLVMVQPNAESPVWVVYDPTKAL